MPLSKIHIETAAVQCHWCRSARGRPLRGDGGTQSQLHKGTNASCEYSQIK